jgi:hypothetical protein
LQRVVILFKSGNCIDFTATPKNAYGMPLPDFVLADNELIFRLEVR